MKAWLQKRWVRFTEWMGLVQRLRGEVNFRTRELQEERDRNRALQESLQRAEERIRMYSAGADWIRAANKLLRLIDEILVPISSGSNGPINHYELRSWLDDYRQYKRNGGDENAPRTLDSSSSGLLPGKYPRSR